MTPQPQESPAALRPCWSCKGPIAVDALFCATCDAVQPPAPLDPFARLGVEARYDIDPADLDRHYFALQRRLHPDRFVMRGSREKALSQQQTAALNDAYEILKDPVRRGAALLLRAGMNVDVDGQGTIADPELLMEAMEMREALAEAGSREEVSRLVASAEREFAAAQSSLGGAFSQGDLDGAARGILRLRYLERLSGEARARLVKFADRVV